MTILKNKNLRKSKKKLILIFLVLIIASLNLFGEDKKEGIGFDYYYYTNKLYHSTLKTEIIPSDYVFITTYSYSNMSSYDEYKYTNLYLYLYNLKTKEKKLFYAYKTEINTYEYSYEDRIINEREGETYYYTRTNIGTNYKYLNEYYDIKGNLTTNWTDTNMKAHGFYEITNNRFGETFYNRIDDYDYSYRDKETIKITKGNNYIQKAYKYSLTQPEIINKKDRGIYLFIAKNSGISDAYLCFQNEYYKNSDSYYNSFTESDLLNYNSNGIAILNYYISDYLKFHFLKYTYPYLFAESKTWITTGWSLSKYTNAAYFNLRDKSITEPTWTEFTNNYLNYLNSIRNKNTEKNIHYSKEDTENNFNIYQKYKNYFKFIGFIPIEEFEYYLLAD